MAEQLAYQLRQEKWLTSTVVVKIRYANFDTETKQIKVSYTSADHTLSRVALELFNKVYTRRMRLRLIGLRFTGLVHGNHQMNLFEDTEEQMNLYQTMDYLKNRYGMGAVGRASGFDFEK
jgi:DNA polymerase-4